VDEWCISCGRIDRLTLFSAIAFQFFSPRRLCAGFRRSLRLRSARARIEFDALTQQQPTSRAHPSVTESPHRFEESIAGRDDLLEVSHVSKDRWRAYIVRIPGMPTALMPFYGRTPAEAARQL
jgi:hypothetical protein